MNTTLTSLSYHRLIQVLGSTVTRSAQTVFTREKKPNRFDSYAEYRTLFPKPKTKKSEQYCYPFPLAQIRVIDPFS